MASLKSIWSSTRRFFEKLLYLLSPESLLPFVARHFFYLIWILLVPIILYRMAQGRELFTGLFDDQTFFSGFRAVFLLLAYFLQAMAITLLPRPFFRKVPLEGPDGWQKVRHPYALKDPGLTYVLTVLPVVMYGLVMIVVQWDRIPGFWYYTLAFGTLAAMIFLCYWFEERWWPFGLRQSLLIVLIIMVLCGALVALDKSHPFWNYYIVGTCLTLQMAVVGGLSRRIYEDFLAAFERPKRLSRYDYLYLATALPLVGIVIFMIFCEHVEAFSPTFMLLTITTFYLIISRLVSALYRFRVEGRRWQPWVFWPLALAGFAVVFFVKSDIHRISTVESALPLEKRVTFDEWFASWKKNNLDTTGTEIPIYLVAVQGGGSRAGLWTSEMLNRLEVASGYRFHRHCLAITSASGGSSGTGATLALWRFAQDSAALAQRSLGSPRADSLYLNFANGMYRRNYLSASFLDMFVCEIGTRFLFFQKDRRNRNYRHQKDEALGFAAGIQRGFYPETPKNATRIGERLRSLWLRGDRARLRVSDQIRVPNYPFMPYLSYWYDAQGQPKTDLPLYFPISTNIQTGKGAFSSPVRTDDRIFTDAIDILAAVKTAEAARGERTLTMVGATNLSQLFPAMNAFTYIPKAGNFLDGGSFENMGLTVLEEIYHRVDSLVRHSGAFSASLRPKVKIHVIYLINNKLETEEPEKIKAVSQFSSLFSFAGSASIDGRTTFFTKKMAHNIGPNDALHELWLQAPAPDSVKLRIPLGRWLSRYSVRRAEARADAWQADIEAIVQPLTQK
jgi:hypothetical protein